MHDHTPADGPIPADDPARQLTYARPGHRRLAGASGRGRRHLHDPCLRTDTAGRYTLIDMHVPPGGGPPPHRHDFEEMFSILDGEIEFTFRGQPTVARAGETVNVPANAPHVFTNASDRPARLLCLCSPAGQEDFFREVGVPVAHRTDRRPARPGGGGRDDGQGDRARAQVPDRAAARRAAARDLIGPGSASGQLLDHRQDRRRRRRLRLDGARAGSADQPQPHGTGADRRERDRVGQPRAVGVNPRNGCPAAAGPHLHRVVTRAQASRRDRASGGRWA